MMKLWLKRWWAWIVIVLVAVVLGGRGQFESETLHATVQQVQTLSTTNRNLVKSLQGAIVESCEVNGNSRAKVEREQLDEEIAEAEHPDPQAFHALVVAGVPARAIREAERKSLIKFKLRLARVKVVNCADQYQISPSDGARRRGHLDSSTP